MTQEEIKALVNDMTLEEKVGQMVQLMAVFYQADAESVLTGPAGSLGLTPAHIRMAGSILGTAGAEELMKLQRDYMERHPHHIPMLFMMDVIHGMKTIFPIPLAQSGAFEPELAKRCAAVMGKEAAVSGLHAVFAPMADLVRDARWGRVMESPGEDPYLNSLYAQAVVQGLQGEDMSDPYKVCACIKHFAAYGAVTAGRDYHTVELSGHTLREFYMPAYEAGIRAGAGLVMTAFHTINGIPATADRWLLRDVLRTEMGFEGVLISDYAAIMETIAHGYSRDGKEAAKNALEAGVDIDMMTNAYAAFLPELAAEQQIDMQWIDEAVFRILELKNKLGLFEHPFKDASPREEKTVILCQEHRALAREAAAKSFVLLKNEGILPLDLTQHIAFIGPYTNNKEMISTWAVTGNSMDCITIEEAAREVFDLDKTTFHAGSPMLDEHVHLKGFQTEGPGREAGQPDGGDEAKGQAQPGREAVQPDGGDGAKGQAQPGRADTPEEMLLEAKKAAAEADVVVLCIGEHYMQTGEAASRAEIDIPGIQMELFREIRKENENIAVVLFNGRPLDLREIAEGAKAVLEVWLPGTEGGHAIVDTLIGKRNPSGCLPMSFPYCVGQLPMCYNEYATGRPYVEGITDRFRSKYIDVPNAPLFPFGYGLSYTTFDISPIELSSRVWKRDDPVTAKVTAANTGKVPGELVLQLYLRDIAASIVRPVKELKGFKKIALNPGERREVVFEIQEQMLEFLRKDGSVGYEEGEFQIWIGDSSITKNTETFSVIC